MGVTELEQISKLSFKYRAGAVNFPHSGSTTSSLNWIDFFQKLLFYVHQIFLIPIQDIWLMRSYVIIQF